MDTVQNPSLFGNSIEIFDAPTDLFMGVCGHDGSEAWIVKKNCLYCVNVKTGETVRKWKCSFGDIYYVWEVISNNHQFLVVATASLETDTSVLVLLSVSSLSVIKSIIFTQKITSVELLEVSFNNGTAYEKLLSSFDGILAVGCFGGATYLVNLCIHQDLEHCPLPIKVINEKEIIEEDIFPSNDLAALLLIQGKISELLNWVDLFFAEFLVDGRFAYQSSITLSDAFVSAIRFASRMSSLFIGYSFGSFVVYNLSDFTVMYSSPYSPQRSSPVTQFIYMEPENDPKCFVYVWVARGKEGIMKNTR